MPQPTTADRNKRKDRRSTAEIAREMVDLIVNETIRHLRRLQPGRLRTLIPAPKSPRGEGASRCAPGTVVMAMSTPTR
jgi:hypothetical protein